MYNSQHALHNMCSYNFGIHGIMTRNERGKCKAILVALHQQNHKSYIDEHSANGIVLNNKIFKQCIPSSILIFIEEPCPIQIIRKQIWNDNNIF